MAPRHIRGLLVSWYAFFLYFGIVVAYWLVYLIVNTVDATNSAQWRIPVGLQFVPATTMMVATYFLPESVRWLVKKGRFEEGLKALAYIRKANLDDPGIVAEFNEIKIAAELELAETDGIRWKELTLPRNMKRLIIGFCVLLFQQTTGTLLFTYYAPTIFQSIGLHGQKTGLFATGLYGIVKCVVTVVYLFFFIERVGRRWMFIQGSVVMGVLVLALGLTLHFNPPNPNATSISSASIGMIAMVFLFDVSFASSWGPTSWLYVGEIFPNRIREYCVGICTCANWIGNLAVSKFFPVAIANIGWWTFIIFFFFNMINLVFAIFFIKETKGVALERMDEVFGAKSLVTAEIDLKEAQLESHVEHADKVEV